MIDYTPRKRNDFIAVHCSDTYARMDIGEAEIRQWHQDKGWVDIGYNIVIRRSGLIEIGRPIDYQGAHVEGFNARSIGICQVGGKADSGAAEMNFTKEQMNSLIIALRFCKAYAPEARIQGHRDFPNVTKACPAFDVRDWLTGAASDLL